jgi:HD-like signal output (HDOD) protein
LLTFDNETFESINVSKLPHNLRINVERVIKKHRKQAPAHSTKIDLELIVLDIAMSLKIHDFGPIGVRLICCQTFKDWLSTFNKHKQLLGLPEKFFRLDQDRYWLVTSTQRDDENQTQAIFNFGLFLRLLKYSFGETLPTINYQVPIKFSQNMVNRLTTLGFKLSYFKKENISFKLNERLLNLGLPDANEKTARVFERDILRTISISTSKETLVADTINAIKTFTPPGEVNQIGVAQQLCISERTFVRRLQQDGTNFREIFNEVRNSQALSLLFQGKSIEYISTLQGFSERATFERAFKKWQGVTPVAMQSRFARLNNETILTDIIKPDQIPNLPGVAARLLQMIRDDETNLSELATLVEQDPVLVAKVLGIANSGAFGHLKAHTVKAAILTILGTQKLQALVLSLASTNAFKVDKKLFDYAAFWHRALCVASFAVKINNLVNPKLLELNDPLFLAGLLHNIGHLVIASCLPNGNKQITLESSKELSFEQLLGLQSLRLGINTLEASAFLVKLWKIPNSSSDILVKLSLTKHTIADNIESPVNTLTKAFNVYDEIEKNVTLLNPEWNTSEICNEISSKTGLETVAITELYDEYHLMWGFVRNTFIGDTH